MMQNEQIPDHPVFSKNVLEVITVANDFCLTMNKSETIDKHKLVEYLTKISPLLYLKGALLPEVEVSDPERNERFFTEEEWEFLFNALRNKFGDSDVFWYADADQSDELIKGSLADQITDIYQDLQDFLLLYQKNSIAAKENAVNELQSLFITNWGKKLLIIQARLHHLFFTKNPDPPQFNIPNLF